MISAASTAIHAARRRAERDRARTRELSALVAAIDGAIQQCEELHLRGRKVPTPDLLRRAGDLAESAREALGAVPQLEPRLARLESGSCRRVVDVMDDLWTVQEEAFDAMLPQRARLPDHSDDAPRPGRRSAA